MTRLTLAQNFALLALNAQDSSRMTAAKRVASRCIAAASILELCLDRELPLDVPFPLVPEDPSLTLYQETVLRTLSLTGAPKTPLDLLPCVASLRGKHLAHIEHALTDSLIGQNLLESIPSLLSCDMYAVEAGVEYTEYRSNGKAYSGLAEQMRAEVLEDGPMTDDAVAQLWLLRESGALRDFLSEEELPHACARMQEAYRDTVLGRQIMTLKIHRASERSAKSLLDWKSKFFSTDAGIGLNFLCPVFERSKSIFIEVQYIGERAGERIQDIRERLTKLGHRWEIVREGSFPLVRIDNVLYECIPDGVTVGYRIRVPVYGVRLRRYPQFL